jgi:hypothetical protein
VPANIRIFDGATAADEPTNVNQFSLKPARRGGRPPLLTLLKAQTGLADMCQLMRSSAWTGG